MIGMKNYFGLVATAAVAALLAAGPVSGQSFDGDGQAPAASTLDATGGGTAASNADMGGGDPVSGGFDALSPGNRKIAAALFDGQTGGGEGTAGGWSLDEIAAAKQSGSGWGQIFREMKAEGLVDAKNLGQLVSGRHKSPATEPAFGGEVGGSAGNVASETAPSQTAAANGASAAANDSGLETAGAFNELSPGNQKIAEALFDGQRVGPEGERQAWTLDDIAAAGQTGDGWGRVFKKMQSEGLIEQRNLGQVVSRHRHGPTHASDGASEITITTATGRQHVIDKRPSRHGKNSGHGNKAAAKSGRRSGLSGRGHGHGSRTKVSTAGGRLGSQVGTSSHGSRGRHVSITSGHGSRAAVTSGAGRIAGTSGRQGGHSGKGGGHKQK